MRECTSKLRRKAKCGQSLLVFTVAYIISVFTLLCRNCGNKDGHSHFISSAVFALRRDRAASSVSFDYVSFDGACPFYFPKLEEVIINSIPT